ncbi:MAG: hypothetical protein RL538_278 [Candidatus Parcubacteria bacterium]|jgi:hypothetical protein
MKTGFDTKRFLKILAGYAIVIITVDALLTHFFDIGEPKQSIIEVFSAVIIFQIFEELYRRYKNKA